MHPMVPTGTQLLGDLVGIDVDRRTLAAGRDPIPEPDEPGSGPWPAYAAALQARIAEVEAENAELRAGALHPTARHLLDLWLRHLRDPIPSGATIEAVAAAPSEDFWREAERQRGVVRSWRVRARSHRGGAGSRRDRPGR